MIKSILGRLGDPKDRLGAVLFFAGLVGLFVWSNLDGLFELWGVSGVGQQPLLLRIFGILCLISAVVGFLAVGLVTLRLAWRELRQPSDER